MIVEERTATLALQTKVECWTQYMFIIKRNLLSLCLMNSDVVKEAAMVIQ